MNESPREAEGEAVPEDAAVWTRSLSKRFGAKWAVDGLDLTAMRGEIFGVLGANGAGKSTTLFMMTGLARPTSGTIRIFGHDPRDWRSRASRIGALVESPAFIPYLTARKNLELLARLDGIVGAAPIDEALERVGLGGAARRKVGGFSQGMRQRLGLAQAIQHRPELLILDEPTNGLDPEGSVEIWRVLREMSAEHGATVVVSSHLLHEIEEHCHRVCVLERGRAAAFGRVADLLADRRPLIEISFDSPETAEKARAWLCDRGLASIEDLAPSVGEFEPSRRVHARVERQDAPTLNRALTEAGMAPIYLAPRRRTLRDYFLNGPR